MDTFNAKDFKHRVRAVSSSQQVPDSYHAYYPMGMLKVMMLDPDFTPETDAERLEQGIVGTIGGMTVHSLVEIT